MIRLLYIISIFVSFYRGATDVLGNVSGEVVIITWSNFGAKSTAYPHYYSEFVK